MGTQTKITEPEKPPTPKSLSIDDAAFIEIWLKHEVDSNGEAFLKDVNAAIKAAHEGKPGKKRMTLNSAMQRVYRLNKRAVSLGYEKRKLPWSVVRENPEDRQRKIFDSSGFVKAKK